MRIAILGGTFNPLHIGHLFLAEEVRFRAGYDKILFVPTFKPAHKEMSSPVPASMRAEMLRQAIACCPDFLFDDCEIRREGVSYMTDTLGELAGKYDFTGKPGVIIGDDLAPGFKTWKNANEILDAADVVIVRRLSEVRVKYDFPHRYLENKIVNLSSSEIRSRIHGGLPVRFLVPDRVYEYIEQHRLYR